MVFVSPKGVIIAKCEMEPGTSIFMYDLYDLQLTDYSCSERLLNDVVKTLDMLPTTMLTIC